MAIQRRGKFQPLYADDSSEVATGPRPIDVPWHESIVTRSALGVVLILGLAFVAATYVAMMSIQSLSKMVFRSDIEQNLVMHMQSLKDQHRLKQELAVERVRHALTQRQTGQRTWSLVDSPEYLNLELGLSELFGSEKLMVGVAGPEFEGEVIDIEWKSKDVVRVGPLDLKLPRGRVYEQFREVEALRQNYQLIGARLEDEIQPALIRSSVLILVLSFVFLFLIFYFLGRRFRHARTVMAQGFMAWSEGDQSFRFEDRQWRGEFRLLMSQFNALADELEENRKRRSFLERLASWQTMARKLAHEIKNPLTPIQMMVSQLRRRYAGDDGDFKKLLADAEQVVTDEVNALRRMVDSFSHFARLPAPRFARFDLLEMMRRCIELQKHAFEHCEFALESSRSQVSVVGDAELLRQVLINLSKNAAEACQKSGKIILRLKEAQQRFEVIEVEDFGPGIPEDIQARIFEAYFTTKHTGPDPGMGLGLALCQKIMLDHNGHIDVESQPGKTVFTVKIAKDLEEFEDADKFGAA